jgi:hypothetical protein
MDFIGKILLPHLIQSKINRLINLFLKFRCNLAVMFLVDLVVEGMEQGSEVDWSVHLPLVLHMAILGLDHTRPLVSEHCKQLLLNLLLVLADHGDHLTGKI